jgi:hypothetical protein
MGDREVGEHLPRSLSTERGSPMTLRWLVAAVLVAALFTGCRGAPARRSSASAPDPDRWERAACNLGEYPTELDARALARARYEDLRARRSGSSSLFAAARLESERSGFAARCAAWRAASASDEMPLTQASARGLRRPQPLDPAHSNL